MANEVIKIEQLARFKQNADNEYAKTDGYYKNMAVGLADNLKTTEGITDTEPFANIRSSGGSADITTGLANIKKLVGNTIVFNQLVENGNFESASGWNAGTGSSISISNNKCTITINLAGSSNGIRRTIKNSVIGHYYLISCYCTASENTRLWFSYGGAYYYSGQIIDLDANKRTLCRIIVQSNSVSNQLNIFPNYAGNYFQSGGTAIIENAQVIDLTQMFGCNDFIPQKYLGANGVLEFIRDFPKPYYAYNEGQLISSKVDYYHIVGYNAFDEEIEGGAINNNTGEPLPIGSNVNAFRTSNFTKVIAGQKYTFELTDLDITGASIILFEYDSNNGFIKRTYISNNQQITLSNQTHFIKFYLSKTDSGWSTNVPSPKICFHLTWSGSKTGYEEYYEEIYPMGNDELMGVNGVGDEKTPDGTITRKFDIIDLGSLEWIKASDNTMFSFYCDIQQTKDNGYSNPANIICSKYETTSESKTSEIGNTIDNSISLCSGRLRIRVDDNTYNQYASGNDFKLAMLGQKLIYELLDEQTVAGHGFTEQTIIDDWGTQEFIETDLSVAVPSGNEILYMKNLKDFLRRIGGRNDINYNPDNLASKTDLLSIDKGVNVINASDISSNTLTQAQYDLITNGKMTIILGSLLSLSNVVLVCFTETSSAYSFQYFSSLEHGVIELNKNSKVLSKVSDSTPKTQLKSVRQINGKNFPAYPSNTGTFTLKCVDGTLTWVDDE